VTATAVLLVTVLLVVIATIFAQRWWSGSGGSYVPPRSTVRADVTPARSLFGDVLTARVRIVVDPQVVDAKNIRLNTSFDPYRVRDDSYEISTGLGRAVVVQFAYELQCTSRECLPRGGGRTAAAEVVHLPPATATLPLVKGGGDSRRVTWPVVAVQSRLTADEIGLSTPKPRVAIAPASITWRFSPGRLAAASFILALLLTFAAAWLVATVVARDRRLAGTRRIPGHLSPIERALVLARHAAAHGELDESRKALERLAVELRRRQAGSHAEAAERLAWSATAPSVVTVDELAQSMRSNGNH